MSPGDVPDLIALIRETLEQLEIEGIASDDPTLLELKRYLVLIIAELQILRSDRDIAA